MIMRKLQDLPNAKVIGKTLNNVYYVDAMQLISKSGEHASGRKESIKTKP